MLAPLLYKFWKHILAVVLIVGALLSIGYSIYSLGYDSCKKDWQAAIAERDRVQASQTEEIKVLSKALVDSRDMYIKTSDETLTKILDKVKSKPLYIYKDGNCYPSKDFEKAYVDIIGTK